MERPEGHQKRSVVVTGASTGIGHACALYLGRHGFHVHAGVRKQEDAERLRQEGGDAVTPLFLDVTDAELVAEAVRSVEEADGFEGLQGLVNNAGIAVGGPMEFMPLERFRWQMEVNVTGLVATTCAFLPLLRKGQGRIVHMGSTSGFFAAPFFGPYAASKYAVEALTDAWRVELKPWKLHVAVVEPGAIATPIWDKAMAENERALESMPEATNELYGPAIDKLRGLVKHGAERGIPPERVAKAVHHALTSPRPKARYRVGPDAQLQWLLGKQLPVRVRDWLVARFLGLHRLS